MKILLSIVFILLLFPIVSAEDIKLPVVIFLKNQPNDFGILEMRAHAEQSQNALKEILEIARTEGKASDIQSLWIVNAIAVNANSELIEKLKLHEDVKSVEPIVPMQLLENSQVLYPIPTSWGITKIGADRVWNQGIDGAGITVAVIDTGIDASHPDLDDLDDNPATNDPKVVDWIDIINNIPTPYDDYGHGTHVSGIISGTKGTGVAPGATLIVAKVLDSAGWGTDVGIAQAMQWALSRSNIISLSLGGYHSNLMTAAVDNAVNAGVVVVAAAGNSGGSAMIRCPADEKNAIAVGATDTDDNIAGFSSRGPVTLYGETYIKPDVSAPGVSINSTWPGGSYFSWSGTSMATPFVSGTIALILQNDSNLTPADIKQRLENTSIDLGDVGKDNTYGAGRIDAYRAVFNIVEPSNPVGIYGIVYNDVNNNKIRDVGEVGLQNWKVSMWGFVGYVYVSKVAYTDVNGMYKFTELSPTSYSMMLTVQSPYIGTTPIFYSGIVYHSGESIKKDFGVRKIF